VAGKWFWGAKNNLKFYKPTEQNRKIKVINAFIFFNLKRKKETGYISCNLILYLNILHGFRGAEYMLSLMVYDS
jgi:hypothetical protein